MGRLPAPGLAVQDRFSPSASLLPCLPPLDLSFYIYIYIKRPSNRGSPISSHMDFSDYEDLLSGCTSRLSTIPDARNVRGNSTYKIYNFLKNRTRFNTRDSGQLSYHYCFFFFCRKKATFSTRTDSRHIFGKLIFYGLTRQLFRQIHSQLPPESSANNGLF